MVVHVCKCSLAWAWSRLPIIALLISGSFAIASLGLNGYLIERRAQEQELQQRHEGRVRYIIALLRQTSERDIEDAASHLELARKTDSNAAALEALCHFYRGEYLASLAHDLTGDCLGLLEEELSELADRCRNGQRLAEREQKRILLKNWRLGEKAPAAQPRGNWDVREAKCNIKKVRLEERIGKNRDIRKPAGNGKHEMTAAYVPFAQGSSTTLR